LKKTFACNPGALNLRSCLGLVLIIGVAALFFLDRDVAGSQISQAPPDDGKIHIKADRVITSIDDAETEFIGNVRVTQGTTHITAHSMKIRYQQNSQHKGGEESIKASIKSIVAKGDVRIKTDNITASTQEAVYDTKADVLILSGNNSRVISGSNSIIGSKFTLYQATEDIIVESGEQDQVKAVLYGASRELF
jgi:lipopolysaccharide transport protein LptA